MASGVRSEFRAHQDGRLAPRSRQCLPKGHSPVAPARLAVLFLLLEICGLRWDFSAAPRTWVGISRAARVAPGGLQGQRIRKSAPLRAAEVEFDWDPNSVVDMTEKKLLGTTLKLTSSVFGFPDFPSLLDLNNDGSLRWYGGMVSKEPGAWSVIEGDPKEGERPEELYIEFTQPLTDRYKQSFTVLGDTCFWRGKLDIKESKAKGLEVAIDGGVVVSEDEGKKNLVREGVFRAVKVDEVTAEQVRKSNAEAFERALMTSKAEPSGFKTPARIAGAGLSRPRRQLPGARDRGESEIDLSDD